VLRSPAPIKKIHAVLRSPAPIKKIVRGVVASREPEKNRSALCAEARAKKKIGEKRPLVGPVSPNRELSPRSIVKGLRLLVHMRISLVLVCIATVMAGTTTGAIKFNGANGDKCLDLPGDDTKNGDMFWLWYVAYCRPSQNSVRVCVSNLNRSLPT
jgi:hypothetical protein